MPKINCVKVVLQKMANTTIATEYLREGGATNDKINYFFIFVAHLKVEGKKHVMKYIDY